MKALQAITDLFKNKITDAKNLEVWVEDGVLFCGQSNITDGFDVEYTINIMMSAVNVQPTILFMHLINWLNKFDIDRAEKGLAMPTFACELLDKGLFDLKIKLDIREEYHLIENENGEWKQNETRYTCESAFFNNTEFACFDDLILIKSDLPCN